MASMDVQVANLKDAVFRLTWDIEAYLIKIDKQMSFDSPHFYVDVNGIRSTWSLSLRFWVGEEGERLTNPVILCLNLLKSDMTGPEQIKRIKFQFGLYNADVKQFEVCPVQRAPFPQTSDGITDTITSLGYQETMVFDRHISLMGTLTVMCKLLLIPAYIEQHSLGQDLRTLMKDNDDADVILRAHGTEFRAHSNILRVRSPVFAKFLTATKKEKQFIEIDIDDLNADTLQEVLRYIYTDCVEGLDLSGAPPLISAADKYQLPGLKALCERTLIEIVTPNSVGALLLVADRFGCEGLKRAALAYCGDNQHTIAKTLTWKLMEDINPGLFRQVCDATSSSSTDGSEASK